MKEFIRFVKSSLIVLTIVVVANILLGFIGDKTAVVIDTVKYKRISRGTEELVILGASRAENQYVSNLIADSLGLSVFDYGVGAQNIYTNYCVLKLLCEKSTSKPKYVIWDFYYTDILDTPGWNTEKLQRLYSAYNYDSSVREVLSLLKREEYSKLKYIPLYKFNSKAFYFLSDFLVSSKETAKGYSPLNVINTKPIEKKTEDRGVLLQSKIEYIQKFISLCKDNDIRLFICIAPGFYKIDNTNESIDWSDVIKTIAAENNVPLYDYEQDPFFLEHPELFYNQTHLNNNGAQIYTKAIIKDISLEIRKCE